MENMFIDHSPHSTFPLRPETFRLSTTRFMMSSFPIRCRCILININGKIITNVLTLKLRV